LFPMRQRRPGTAANLLSTDGSRPSRKWRCNMSSPAPLIAGLLGFAATLLVAGFSAIPLAGASGPENPVLDAALSVSLPMLGTLVALAIPAGLGAQIGRRRK